MTPPNQLLISSCIVEFGAHDRVSVWNRGGLAGELKVTAGDGPKIAELLGLVPDCEAVDRAWIRYVSREHAEWLTTSMSDVLLHATMQAARNGSKLHPMPKDGQTMSSAEFETAQAYGIASALADVVKGNY